MANLRREIFYIPNLLTMFRIVLIPVVLYFIDNESALHCFFASLFYGVSAVTDFFDGYLARISGRVSLLGKFLDPLADKLLVMATLVWMVPLGRIEAWVVVLLLARELSITSLRGIASAEGLIIAARQWGKDKTFLQMIGVLCLITHFRYPIYGTDYYVDFHQVGLYTIYISLVLSVFSAVEYLQLFARSVAQQEEASQAAGVASAPLSASDDEEE
ncbi:MAG: CDP-diacylglycerol--glycerol-3-phosphate 3-phosphatidyltransferase [Deltaproteobacteria bacterium]|nr:CDP-diacylglycerol--glycerol-3-phosphate 3-phosphatidyltransferase [Deltaproteobacteria bacterium]